MERWRELLGWRGQGVETGKVEDREVWLGACGSTGPGGRDLDVCFADRGLEEGGCEVSGGVHFAHALEDLHADAEAAEGRGADFFDGRFNVEEVDYYGREEDGDARGGEAADQIVVLEVVGDVCDFGGCVSDFAAGEGEKVGVGGGLGVDGRT